MIENNHNPQSDEAAQQGQDQQHAVVSPAGTETVDTLVDGTSIAVTGVRFGSDTLEPVVEVAESAGNVLSDVAGDAAENISAVADTAGTVAENMGEAVSAIGNFFGSLLD